ncbi:MAG TPA: L,D-transpeptidase family protein [Polyangia bacterium]|jgi:L,D-peptidoglycan transpeptidase YkuD (ErfK/YbiS/YcfS/YnhG family)
MRVVLQALLLAALAPNAFAEAPARKMITVVTADWEATTGELRRWERAGKSWRQVGAVVPVVVGRKGLWWAEAKREGDLSSPAGRFALGDVTGYDEKPPRGLKLRYRWADHLVCDDDPDDREYNRVIEGRADESRGEEAKPYEKMHRDDELYRFTIFVRHNPERRPGNGSCIFLHVWRGANSPTVGCTAMALEDLRALLLWVDRKTILVQLPSDQYDKRQREWDLPPLVQRK